MQSKIFVLMAMLASVTAFAPSAFVSRPMTHLSMSWVGAGKYDDKLFDNEAKKDVYNAWDPTKPRSSQNFNPFETFKGNTPDASGVYPGEPRYKDPIRGDANFQQMMLERAEAEERAKNPKAGDVPGAPGRKS
eukprot:CAMPEP_0172415174 /NCGR_PEP_ID=MMETSP1064-20121228/1662_1 /TAXON_ID=202472 /ORGANISM="Aulacoseira subarctica , Strain CCAP 1002/5" /LENGTH=132 /DNA_ID=CAMNT_0013152081 /DNA_START=83 /DNA_END=482 /DNA_ORIENTATION=-